MLSACSENKNDESATPSIPTPSAPALSLGFGIKQLKFNWTAAEDTSHYQLLQNPDGVSGFTQAGGNLTTTGTTLAIAAHRHDWANARYVVRACNSAGCTSSNEVNTAVSPNRLTAVIPAADVASAGTAQVRVFNPAPGGGTSNVLTFTVVAPAGATVSR